MSWNALPRRTGRIDGHVVVGGLEDRQHHLADDGCRAVHVDEQVVPGVVRLDGEVHRHRAQEAAEALRIDGEGAHRVDDRLQHRIVGAARIEIGEEAVAEIGECGGAVLDRDVSTALGRDLVDDVVGVPGERVQRVDMVLFDLRQHLRRPVVGRAVALVEVLAERIALVEGDRPVGQQVRRRHRWPTADHLRETHRPHRTAAPAFR